MRLKIKLIVFAVSLVYFQCSLGFRASGSSQVMRAARFFPALAPAAFIMPGWKPHFVFCGGDQPPLYQKPPSKMNKRELAECLECSLDFASQHGKGDLVEMLREKRLRVDPPVLAPQAVPGHPMQDELVIPEPVAGPVTGPVAESSGKTMQLKVGMREPEPGSEQDYYVRAPQPGSKMSYC